MFKTKTKPYAPSVSVNGTHPEKSAKNPLKRFSRYPKNTDNSKKCTKLHQKTF